MASLRFGCNILGFKQLFQEITKNNIKQKGDNMKKNFVLLIMAVLMVLSGWAIAKADEVGDLEKQQLTIQNTLNKYAAQLQLLDEQIAGLLTKRQQLNRLAGMSIKDMNDVNEYIKELSTPVPEPKE